VAKLMFEFWRNLLEAGGDIGDGPRRVRADHERLWRTQLKSAFPGGRLEAASQSAQFTRSWTLGVVMNVHALRNRAAHHEPLVNGFPLPGEQRRLSADQGHQACLQLARLLDRDLAAWLVTNSQMARHLPRDPARRHTPSAATAAAVIAGPLSVAAPVDLTIA